MSFPSRLSRSGYGSPEREPIAATREIAAPAPSACPSQREVCAAVKSVCHCGPLRSPRSLPSRRRSSGAASFQALTQSQKIHPPPAGPRALLADLRPPSSPARRRTRECTPSRRDRRFCRCAGAARIASAPPVPQGQRLHQHPAVRTAEPASMPLAYTTSFTSHNIN